MNREQEILARAMNHIDDRYVLAAHAPRRRLHHALPALVAACLCVVILAVYPFLRELINVENDLKGDSIPAPEGGYTTGGDEDEDKDYAGDANSGTGKPEINSYYGLGTSTTLGGTTLTMTEVTDTTATFTVVKTDTKPLYVMLFDLKGNPLTTSEEGYRLDGGVIIRNSLHFTVNGATETVKILPSSPGTYTVTVDFSAVRDGTYPMLDYMGLYAYVDKDNQPLMRQFSLVIPQDAETVADTDTPGA